jgi:hypothetical protein
MTRTPVNRSIQFFAWDVPVSISAVGGSLDGARALVERLESLWDVSIADSDLHRVFAWLGTVVAVEPETVALVELAARAAWRQPKPPAALHDVVIDLRHSRVGLPGADLLDLDAMRPVLAVALVVRYFAENGASYVRVRVGDAVRTTGVLAA